MSGINEFVKEYPIADIKPHPNNPRVHPDSAIEKLQRSIQEFGFVNPVLISKDGILLAGHARIKASKSQKLDHVPALILDLEGAKADAYLIADNKLQEETEWDLPVLKDLLEELDTGEFPLELTGFEMPEIEDLLTYVNDLDPGEAADDGFDEDAALEDIEEPVSKPGDVWKLGKHRLIVGDATKPDDIEKLMDGRLADMVFTDPPYNVAYEGKTKDALRIQNDEMDNEQFYQFLFDFYTNVFNHTKEGGPIYICHADSEGINFRSAMKDSGWLLKQCIIWVKDIFVMGRQDYHWKHEPILYGWKPGSAHKWWGDRKQSTVWNVDRPKRSAEHPTMKPIELVGKALENSSRPGDLVIDTFSGSGATLMACHQMERVCYGMELDPKYADVIVHRWETYTGEKAVKESAEEAEVNA